MTDGLIVIVLTIYFLADLPRIRALGYRFVPRARRPRAILIGDDILAKIGAYVLGNLAISVIAGVLTFVWLLVSGSRTPFCCRCWWRSWTWSRWWGPRLPG